MLALECRVDGLVVALRYDSTVRAHERIGMLGENVHVYGYGKGVGF